MNLTRIIIALLLALAVASSACGDDDTDSSASPSETEDGTARPTPVLSLPADFPESFPLFPDMAFDQGARFSNQVLAAFTAPADSGEVASFYREELAKEPWELLSEDTNSQGNVVTMTVRNEEAETRGTVTFSEPNPGGGTQVSTTFIVPQLASPLPTFAPIEDSPTPVAEAD